MPECGRPECLCAQDSEDAFREFFVLWEALVTTKEERDMTLAAEQATGKTYWQRPPS